MSANATPDILSALTHGSLFSGIGGFDLGFERAGITTVWQVEIDPYCRRVLAKHFPDAVRFSDIRNCCGSDHANSFYCEKLHLSPVDILSGGFPCQDISNAGKRAGIDGERSGLWSEYARIIRELRPRYVVVENVAALLGRGMERVLGDLAACGYDAEWQSIRASDVGAPHRRERIWIVAYPFGSGVREQSIFGTECGGAAEPKHDCEISDAASVRGPAIFGDESDGVLSQVLADASSARRDGRPWQEQPFRGGPLLSARSGGCGDVAEPDSTRRDARRIESGLAEVRGERPDLGMAASQCRTDVADSEGQPRSLRPAERERPRGPTSCDWWAVEPNVGRVAHGIPARVDRLRGLGNAIVPQIAECIGNRIVAAEYLGRKRESAA